MDFRNILKTLALINFVLATIFLTDIAVAIIYGEMFKDFLIFELIFIAINAFIYFSLRNHKVSLNIKGSIFLANIVWILLGFIGAIPLYIYSQISFSSAFFEAISGFTTTGATIYNNIEALPHMLLFHRSLMHWLGGLGVVVLSIGLLSIINPTGSLSLFKAESTGVELEKMTPKIKDTAIRLWVIYFSFTAIETVLLKIFGMNWFDAINHAFSTMSTGGFSTKNDSIGYYYNNDAIVWTITIFMIIAGINFLAHLKLFFKKENGYNSSEVKIFLLLFLALSVILTLVHAENAKINLYDSAKDAFFTIASVMTTTGFATTDYNTWSHFAIALIFIGIILSANSGSTAGGIKTIRFLIIFKAILTEFKLILHPNTIFSIYIDKNRVKERVLSATFAFITLFLFTVAIVAVYIYARDFDAMTAISGAFAIVGNIGPGFSQVGPACNFSIFSDFDKIFFSIAMIIGRLECFTVYILFTSAFWKRF